MHFMSRGETQGQQTEGKDRVARNGVPHAEGSLRVFRTGVISQTRSCGSGSTRSCESVSKQERFGLPVQNSRALTKRSGFDSHTGQHRQGQIAQRSVAVLVKLDEATMFVVATGQKDRQVVSMCRERWWASRQSIAAPHDTRDVVLHRDPVCFAL